MTIFHQPDLDRVSSEVTPVSPLDTMTTTTLSSQFQSASEKSQLQLIPVLVETGEAGLAVLTEFLLNWQMSSAKEATQVALSNPASILVAGSAYQALLSTNSPRAIEFLQTHFPTGLITLKSDIGLDYTDLQALLAKQEFQVADQLTLQKLCEIAGPAAVQRKWLYFTEIDQFPITDLHTINTLWLIHSEGKFGFSIQREIWLSVGKNWDKLWSKIGWKDGNNWTRYPQEFTWNLTAPRGHLPLSNQLRGVRVIAALLTHPAWIK